mmetsp:Transcript_1158/g.1788  ORF Transcript_1158/g.1788 Transcript_1158/m.1788 type:complete len:309 (-) Transcript_1158:21-947(-)|eukprot:CAMPEP_0171458790 /NCGR_PEP_ID=MMETSP0945-20130129/4333_1 /TAXON_ID=109269 /ORGANISM="Vaucheria litorea, Strain CCMP2940" /LENGTH=308 /DNA_ID=CAMNT_0011984679 /DNA_START=119 /DNA_END=1048 /DNA_ORIENTATION=+
MADDSKIIDGNSIAKDIRSELKKSVEKFVGESAIVPGLAVILVGDRRDSATYVRMKRKACEEVGIQSFLYKYPDSISQDDILRKVLELNSRSDVHGILVQLPLPREINETAVLDAIIPNKDVDGLHPLNVAKLCCDEKFEALKYKNWNFAQLDFHVPCTPQGCIELLDRSGVTIEGKHAVILGRSNIVGIPLSLLLLRRNATVTIVHSRSTNVPQIVKSADIVLAAMGRAEMVRGDWVKQGAVVIDVGINTIDDSSKKSGYRLVGDVKFDEVKNVASKITPVPGGVGPMTIAMLLRNTVSGAIRASSA